MSTRLPYLRPVVRSIPRPRPRSELPDKDLVDAMRSGDREAWTALCRRHKGYIIGTIAQALAAVRRQGGRLACGTEDVLQEMLLALPRLLRGYRAGAGQLRPYLAAAVRHAVYGLAASPSVGGRLEERREAFEPEMYRHWLYEQYTPTPEQIVSAREQLEHVSAVASRLTPALRRTWVARAVDGLSTREAAARLDTTPGYVVTTTSRAWASFYKLAAARRDLHVCRRLVRTQAT